MKRGLVVVSVLLALVLFLTSGAAAGKRKQRSVPLTPEIPENVLPPSLQLPVVPESLTSSVGSPTDALQVVAAFLELTPEQVSTLRSLLEQRHETIVPLIQQIAEKQQQIAEQLSSGAPDPATIGQLVIEISQLIQQVHQAQASFLEAFNNLLNEEQRRRYQAIKLAELLQPLLPAFRLLRLI